MYLNEALSPQVPIQKNRFGSIDSSNSPPRPPVIDNQLDNNPLSNKEVLNYLQAVAQQTWVFLKNHLDPTTGLPFDRVEAKNGENHLRKITSPSNIGLAFLNYVASDQMGFIDREEAMTQVRLLISSLENLETRDGMFLNWYHTDSCQLVKNWPSESGEVLDVHEFVSSVDNAWLAVGLLIAGEHFPDLKIQIDAILNKMNFCVFFDEDSLSFAGGVEESGELAGHRYTSEFLTEARILYYVSYSLGQINRESLQNYLDKFPNSSYGGSIFETLMPLLVFDEQNLSYESIMKLIDQQRDAGKEHGFWGFSPCDNPGEHYEEFGVGWYSQHGFDVITFHALFLAFPYAPVEVLTMIRNLMDKINVWSENGFDDAVNVRKEISSKTWLFLDQSMIFLSIYLCLVENNFRKKVG